MTDITQLLRRLSRGDVSAEHALIPHVYDELRRIAARQLRRESRDKSLGATGLVHEAYLRIGRSAHISWQDRAHFFAVASRVMRRILIDRARRATAAKRGSRPVSVPLAHLPPPFAPAERVR